MLRSFGNKCGGILSSIYRFPLHCSSVVGKHKLLLLSNLFSFWPAVKPRRPICNGVKIVSYLRLDYKHPTVFPEALTGINCSFCLDYCLVTVYILLCNQVKLRDNLRSRMKLDSINIYPVAFYCSEHVFNTLY